jgi:8-hydroxy-5-deazaflavin:NADPH oxidoreductase
LNWAVLKARPGASHCLFRATRAKAIVLKLVDDLGFDGVDAGALDESWRQQPGTPVYTKDFDGESVRRALSEATKDRTLEWRGAVNSIGSFTAPA